MSHLIINSKKKKDKILLVEITRTFSIFYSSINILSETQRSAEGRVGPSRAICEIFYYIRMHVFFIRFSTGFSRHELKPANCPPW